MVNLHFNTPMNLFKRFIFRGCWQCGKEGHSRHECQEWKALLDSQGQPPKGHMGMKDKALAKWKAEKAAHQATKKKKTVNSLLDDSAADTEDAATDEQVEIHRLPPSELMDHLGHCQQAATVACAMGPLPAGRPKRKRKKEEI